MEVILTVLTMSQSSLGGHSIILGAIHFLSQLVEAFSGEGALGKGGSRGRGALGKGGSREGDSWGGGLSGKGTLEEGGSREGGLSGHSGE